MKQNLRFLMLALLCAVFSTTWGQTTVIFTPGTDTGETSVTKNGVTVTMTTMNNASYYQIYANQSGTFTCSNGNITKIEFICTAEGTSKYGPGNSSANVGTYTYSNFTGTWTGSAESVTISSTAQVRMKSLSVTYTSGDTPSTTYSVTYDCNGGTSGCPSNQNGVSAGQKITIAGEPTRTDYTFDGWSDGTDLYDAGDEYTVNGNVTFTAQWTESTTPQPSDNVYTLFSGELIEGNYIIYYNGKAMKNSRINSTTKRLGYSEVTPTNDVIENPDASIVWHIAPSGDYWTIYNTEASKYAANTGNTSNNNEADMQADLDDKALWTVSKVSDDKYEFINKYRVFYNLGRENLRNNGSNGFACYNPQTVGGPLTLYKASSGKLPIASNLPSSLTSENLFIGATGSFSLTGTTYAEGQTYTTSWESLSPDIITFDGDNYTTIGTGQAQIKVTITPTGTSADSYHEVYREYTVYVERKNAEIEAIADMNLQTGETQQFTVSCNSDATISISSSNENVVSVSNSGNNTWIVTAVGKGSATVTVTSPATKNYKQAEVTFGVKVTGSLAPGVLFYESFDSSDGKGGNDGTWGNFASTSSLICDNEGWETSYVHGASACARLGTSQNPGSATSPTIATQGGAVTITFKAGSWTSDNATLSVDILDGTTVKETKSYNLPDAQFGNYTINITGVNNLKLKFYTASGYNRLFLDEIEVKEATPITATFNHKYKGFTSIYYADKNLKVPADVTAHTYKVVNGKGEYITNIPAEGVIPAGTPVILEYGKSFTEAVTVTFEEVESAEPLNDGNMLRGSDDVDSNGLTTAPGNGKQADYYYYVLSVGKSSENANKIGFYWKLQDGGPFTPTPHKIYLALLQSEVDANNASIISIYDSDGIDSIAASDYTTQDVYSLSGVRMNGKDLPKGIYIIGGKKVVIK